MSARGRGLLVLAGVRPRGAGGDDEPKDENDDEDGPPSSSGDDYEPSPETLHAGEDALRASQAKDADAFTRAVCALIDAHNDSKKG